jgi:hypothetical protein
LRGNSERWRTEGTVGLLVCWSVGLLEAEVVSF